MKKLTSFLAIMGVAWMALVFVTRAIAQPPPSIDRGAFEKRLEGASNQQSYAMVRAAFEKKDIETLMACNDAGKTQGDFLEIYQRSKDEELKARLAERMLRDERLWQPDPPLTKIHSRQVIASFFTMGLIREAISQRLGNVSPVEDLIADAELRLHLADQLQTSLGGRTSVSPVRGLSDESPPKQNPSFLAAAPPTAKPPAAQSHATANAQIPAVPSERYASLWLWVAGILIPTVFIAIVLKRRT